jgi:hypothetical protein
MPLERPFVRLEYQILTSDRDDFRLLITLRALDEYLSTFDERVVYSTFARKPENLQFPGGVRLYSTRKQFWIKQTGFVERGSPEIFSFTVVH